MFVVTVYCRLLGRNLVPDPEDLKAWPLSNKMAAGKLPHNALTLKQVYKHPNTLIISYIIVTLSKYYHKWSMVLFFSS